MVDLTSTKTFFKSTIPADWEVKTFGEVCEKLLDGTHFSPQTKQGPFKYITSKNIRNDGLDLTDLDYISEMNIVKFTRGVQ